MKNRKRFPYHLFLPLFILFPAFSYGQGIEIEAGGSIALTGAASVEINNGDFINNGTYTRGTETVIFSGDAAKIISGNNTTFHDLSITNTEGISTQLDELKSNDLTIETGGKFTIDAGKAVTVEGDFSNSTGTFIVDSDDLSVGSLIVVGSSTGDVNFNSYLTADQWHIVSPPVSTQSINSFLLNGSNNIPKNPGGSEYGITDYNELNNGWSPYFTTATIGDFVAGKGYLMRRHTSDGTVSYAGNLVYIDHTFDISGVDCRWNAVGNPFTSAIGITSEATSIENFLTENADNLDPDYTAIYIWNEAADYNGTQNSYYVICNSGYNDILNYPRELNVDYLQAGQGFLVKAESGGGTLVFNKAMQIHQVDETLLKSAKVSWDGLTLVAKRGEETSSTIVTFHEGMTQGLDPSFDVGLLSSNPDFSIYSRLLEDNVDINFTIQSLPAIESSDFIVPVGIDLTAGGDVSFSTRGVYLPGDINITIEDRNLGIFKDLTDSEAVYKIWIEDGTGGTGRFFLHIGSSIAQPGDEDDNQNNVIAYYHSQHIWIKGNVSEGSLVRLVDLHGRMVGNYRLEPGRNNSIPVSEITNGFYLLTIIDGAYEKTTKLLIN